VSGTIDAVGLASVAWREAVAIADPSAFVLEAGAEQATTRPEPTMIRRIRDHRTPATRVPPVEIITQPSRSSPGASREDGLTEAFTPNSTRRPLTV
jgi:hypothetical protein